MQKLALLLILFVALEHILFMVLEMFYWNRKLGRKIFGHNREDGEKSRVLAANQGLYNGFIAAGLIWGVAHPSTSLGQQIILFFLICATIAGIYGGLTAKKSIVFIQGLPAFIAAVLVAIESVF